MYFVINYVTEQLRCYYLQMLLVLLHTCLLQRIAIPHAVIVPQQHNVGGFQSWTVNELPWKWYRSIRGLQSKTKIISQATMLSMKYVSYCVCLLEITII